MSAGYAVIDTETTGIQPGRHHRVAEIAVIHLTPAGVVTDEWSTLLNPDRDLGPQAIHGIRAAQVWHAPRFDQMAGDLVDRLSGRIVVAHNWPFDAMHLRAEFERIGVETPFEAEAGLCTMRAASVAMPGSRRSLIDCCATAGLPEMRWHTARDDAMAAAALLGFLLKHHPSTVRHDEAHVTAAGWTWPDLARGIAAPVNRTPIGQVEPHFLARLVDRMPRDEEPAVDAYFAMLDDALLDRQISASEGDALIKVAYELGMHKSTALAVHHTYLRELARASWADGVLTDHERRDVETVAILLGLNQDTVERVLSEEESAANTSSTVSLGGLALRPGDKVVLTGAMRRDRGEIRELAIAAGLRVMTAVSKKTRVVAAADPDSLSGKAKAARALGVPVVNETAFLRVLDAMPVQR
ncbi:MAG: exonuclease domain-containing protein [Actinomycetota bacterium]|nr:exonuclease domain-containing protein [Actinomycetota bacterium]